MAQVFSPPAGMDPPEFKDYKDENGRWDFNAHLAAEEEYIASLQKKARQHAPASNNLIGEVVRFQIADGYAIYIVWKTKPLQLVWVPVGDAWSIPEAHARGLRVTDIREIVERQRRLSELFGRST